MCIRDRYMGQNPKFMEELSASRNLESFSSCSAVSARLSEMKSFTLEEIKFQQVNTPKNFSPIKLIRYGSAREPDGLRPLERKGSISKNSPRNAISTYLSSRIGNKKQSILKTKKIKTKGMSLFKFSPSLEDRVFKFLMDNNIDFCESPNKSVRERAVIRATPIINVTGLKNRNSDPKPSRLAETRNLKLSLQLGQCKSHP
eukprot:TRINITY_DN11978_c0_g1_i1.p1 TRINITY_DN11978_c0_g1~~TRINITY_DN11978_c0_g1_i1.p1  ORF type:complete len:201 (+),score=4.83 TRINITY_DN11978_c0_g1_i1:64-666(+)